MLNFASSLAKAGLIHPDALAGDSSKAKNRFWAGKTVIAADGTGAWNKGDLQSGVAANPSYERQGSRSSPSTAARHDADVPERRACPPT